MIGTKSWKRSLSHDTFFFSQTSHSNAATYIHQQKLFLRDNFFEFPSHSVNFGEGGCFGYDICSWEWIWRYLAVVRQLQQGGGRAQIWSRWWWSGVRQCEIEGSEMLVVADSALAARLKSQRCWVRLGDKRSRCLSRMGIWSSPTTSTRSDGFFPICSCLLFTFDYLDYFIFEFRLKKGLQVCVNWFAAGW